MHLFSLLIKKLISIFFYILSMFGQKKKVYLFGSDTGSAGSNSYALFQYMEARGYTCYWVIKGVAPLTLARGDFLQYGSLKHISKSLSAKVFFITHTLNDVFYCKPYQCKVVNLWHGMPIKKIGYDSNIFLHQIKYKKFLGITPEFNSWDYFICSSPYYKQVFKTALGLAEQKLIVSGSPRNSCYENNNISVRKAREILYLPTYRPWPSGYLNFLLEPSLNDFLIKNELKLVVRLHPYERNKIDLGEGKNIIFDNSTNLEVLFSRSLLLITDISSAIYDYYLLQKAVVIFATDYFDYIERIGGTYLSLDRVYKNYFSTELISLLSIIESITSKEPGLNVELRDFISPETEKKSCEILVKYLSEKGVL